MSRLDKLKENFPELNVTLIDIIVKADPTNTYKYCDFIVNNVIQNLNMDNPTLGILKDLDIEWLKRFEEHSKANRIENKDISQHKNFSTIIKEVQKADEVVKLKEIEKQTIKLYENSEWLVMIPQTFEAAALYGKNTKWCITQKSYWNVYSKHSKIIYILNRKTDEKYAISNRYSEFNIEGWTAKDKCVSPLIWEFTDEIWVILHKELRLSRVQTELRLLNNREDVILLSNNTILSLDEATNTQLHAFKKKFNKHISKSFLEKLEERINLTPPN